MVHEISWGAVSAGAAMAIVIQLILNMIGVGIGLATIDVAQSERPSASSLSIGAGLWWVISGVLAASVGGYIAGAFPESRPNHTLKTLSNAGSLR